jgi:twitching motility protein PilT
LEQGYPREGGHTVTNKTITAIDDILRTAVDKDASDVHIKAGTRPTFRIHRELHIQEDFPVMSNDITKEYLNAITTENQRQIFYRNWELDFAYTAEGVGRFRTNAYIQLGTISLVFRWVRTNIPTIEQLGLPEVCKTLAMKRDGLVILTGPTGCGKSTTLAAMLDYMNEKIKRNVVTIEDPVEFLHRDNMCTFSQREVGVDTHSFAEALKHVLRQDPDVILVGEMRDVETMATALTAAETGHLVLSTLHTPSSYDAIDRFVDAFPPYQHTQIRLQLSTTLQGVLYQVLIPAASEDIVIPAVEVLIASPAIKNLIREGKTFQMPNFMHTGQEMGMQTLDQAVIELYRSGKISADEAASRIHSADNLSQIGGLRRQSTEPAIPKQVRV